MQVIRTTLPAGSSAIAFPRAFKIGTTPTVTISNVFTIQAVNQVQQPNATFVYPQCNTATEVHIIAIGEAY